jgi:hypothetical protein
MAAGAAKESIGNMNRLKKMDAELYSVVGAAGELLQLERNCRPVEKTLYSTIFIVSGSSRRHYS